MNNNISCFCTYYFYEKMQEHTKNDKYHKISEQK